MSRINEKLGLKPAGQKRWMKGSGKTAEAAALTSAQCVNCGDRWLLENVIRGVKKRLCTRCGTTQPLTGGRPQEQP